MLARFNQDGSKINSKHSEVLTGAHISSMPQVGSETFSHAHQASVSAFQKTHGTSYNPIFRSAVMMVTASHFAWAISNLSNGSR
jgi:hypothetical protein